MESWHSSRRHDPSVRRGSRPVYQFRSKRYREDYELVSDFETIGDWVLGGGDSINVDAVNFKEGSQGISWRSINNVTTLADRTIALNALGKHFEMWVYIDDVDNLAGVDYYIRSVDGTWNHYFILQLGLAWNGYRTGWNKLSLSRGNFGIGAGAPDWGSIDVFRLRATSVLGTTVNVTFDDFRMVLDRFSAKVTLRFDDALLTTYTEARARMDEYGFRGVAPVPISWLDTGWSMDLAQLEHLQERGWDIISHAVNHTNLTTLTPAEVENELWNSQRWLTENGFFMGSRFFVPPGQGWNTSVLDQIKKYYRGCQTLTGTGWLENIPPPDPYRMVNTVIDDATPVATITGWIDNAIATQGWLTLLFHYIDAGHFPPANFQAVIDYLNTHGVEVVTFSDVFDELIGRDSYTQLLEFGVQGVITPNAASYPCPGGGLAAQTANEIKIPISGDGWLKNLRVKQRVASGAGGRTDIYTVRVGGVDTDLICTLDNATEGDDLVSSMRVGPGDEVSVKLVSNDIADTTEDVFITVELERLM